MKPARPPKADKPAGRSAKSFGFCFNQGGFRSLDDGFPAKGMLDFSVDAAPEGTLEHKMASAGLTLAMLDLQQLTENTSVYDWFNKPQLTQYSWGSFKDCESQLPLWPYKLYQEFDVLVYVDSTTPVKPINDADSEYDASLDKKLEYPANLNFENNKSGEEPNDWVIWSKFKRLGAELVISSENPL